MSVRPLHDFLFIERSEADEKTPGGLYIPDKAQKKPHRGKVIYAGPGKKNDAGQIIPMDVQPGDVVLYADGVGVDVNVDGRPLVLISEQAVLAEIM